MEMFQEPPEMREPGAPTVIIVGAGLGGLTLAILLEKAKIEYLIFEKALEVKPLGMVHFVSQSSRPLFFLILGSQSTHKRIDFLFVLLTPLSIFRAHE
jgi:glycine/D-amino acid oxidase-like deaminating enzyme